MFALSLLLPTVALAQDSESETEAKPFRALLEGTRGVGGFGGSEFGVALVGGRAGYRLAARGGWLLHPSFAVGAYVESLNSTTPDARAVQLTAGGISAEALVAPRSPIHASFEVGASVGSLTWGLESQPALAPYGAVRVDLNVVPWFRASVGPSLRGLVSGAVPVGTSRVTGGLDVALRFGRFDRTASNEPETFGPTVP